DRIAITPGSAGPGPLIRVLGPTMATIGGLVKATNGAVIPGATVKIIHGRTNLVAATLVTDVDGHYEGSVPPDDYFWLVSKDGYRLGSGPGAGSGVGVGDALSEARTEHLSAGEISNS